MPNPLNEQERRVLDYIVGYLQSNTYQPSIREIGREFSIKSTKTVSELLQSLADKGWIERDPSRSRGVRLLGLEMRPDTVSLAVATQSEPAIAPYVVDRRFAAAAGAYLLVVDGDHLAEDGIRAGDLAVVEPVEPGVVEVGDVVVVALGGALSARRCQSTGPAMVLEATRAGEAPLTLTGSQISSALQGCVTTVIRRLRPALQQPLAVSAEAI